MMHLKLANPTTVKNNKTKFSDDISDAEFLAGQMRLGALKAADIIPKQVLRHRFSRHGIYYVFLPQCKKLRKFTA